MTANAFRYTAADMQDVCILRKMVACLCILTPTAQRFRPFGSVIFIEMRVFFAVGGSRSGIYCVGGLPSGIGFRRLAQVASPAMSSGSDVSSSGILSRCNTTLFTFLPQWGSHPGGSSFHPRGSLVSTWPVTGGLETARTGPTC